MVFDWKTERYGARGPITICTGSGLVVDFEYVRASI
jgi:hypothetical protein